jgi:putative ABC transport system permease protein
VNDALALWRSHLALAVRTLRADPLNAAINISGLALATAACILVLLYARYEWSYDRFWPDAERIAKLTTTLTLPGQDPRPESTAAGVAMPLILQELPQIEVGARMLPRTLRVLYRSDSGERRENPQSWFVDPDFFKIFPLEFLAGDPGTALAGPQSLVLLESTARAWFGRVDVVGREVEVELPRGATWMARVSGVVREPPPNSHLGLQHVLVRFEPRTFAFNSEAYDSWGASWTRSFIKLKPGHTAESLREDLARLLQRHVPETARMAEYPLRDVMRMDAVPLHRLHLMPELADSLMRPSGSAVQVMLMVAVALSILVVATINFINLSIAQAGLRQREVALRKVLGAARGQVAAQFLSQSLLSATLGVLVGLVLVELLLPQFRAFLDRPVPDVGIATLLAAALLVLLLGLGAGALPAWRMAGVHPGHALRPNRSSSGNMGRAAAVLVFAQFAVATGLMAALVVAYQQYRDLARVERGYDPAGVFTLFGLRWPEVRLGRDSFMQQVGALPGVVAVAVSGDVPASLEDSVFGSRWWMRPVDPKSSDSALIHAESISPKFFDAYGIAPIAGRLLGTEIERDSADTVADRSELAQRGVNVVISEATVRALKLGAASSAVGTDWLLAAQGLERPVPITVVGVVPDTRWLGLSVAPAPQLYFVDKRGDFFFTVRARPEAVPSVIEQVSKIWAAQFPRVAYEPEVLNEKLQRELRQKQRPSVVFAVAALIAVLLSAIGMYTLSAFAAQRHARELALRRLMGASSMQVGWLMLARLTRPVLLAAVVACPLAWFALATWLSQSAARVELTPWPFALAVVAAILLAWLVAVGRVAVAVRRRLADELRYE